MTENENTNELITLERELTETEARSLSPVQVATRKKFKWQNYPGPKGHVVKHITELTHSPVEYYEWFWVAAPVCPNCDGFIPNNENPGAYMGAISRRDNKTEICSSCGVNEALEDFYQSQKAGSNE
jgi:hypothetical protein